MFTALKTALATTKAKVFAVLFGALIAVILTLATLYHFQGQALTSTSSELALVKDERDRLQQQLQLKQASDKINDTVRQEVDQSIDNQTQVHESISEQVTRDVDSTRTELQQSGASEAQVADAIAVRSYGGLWDHFCATVPDNPGCAARRPLKVVPTPGTGERGTLPEPQPRQQSSGH